jgi:isocitrate lyase
MKEQIAAAGARKEEAGESILDTVTAKFLDLWQMEAKLKTYGQAVADVIRYHADEGSELEMSVAAWEEFASRVSFAEARDRAKAMGISVVWDRELPRTPEGYYQIEGGIDYSIARSIAAAPFADLLWMETKTADLEDARKYAEGVHAVYPDKMLAYNLSPSFSWDTTGMTDAQMRDFPEELGKLGFVFNFITYGGHQIDGLASEEFATALREDGMLALARVQRKFRLLGSPYRTPQTYVGGPRSDAALMAATGRTATTKAMGKGSTQFQHLVQTEVPPRVLESWLKIWAAQNKIPQTLRVKLRPHTAGSDLLSLRVTGDKDMKVADVTFAAMQDRWNKPFLSIRDQNNHLQSMRQKRLMTLLLLFLIHRYKPTAIHFVAPTEGNLKQAGRMKTLGIYTQVTAEIGQIIVASINDEYIRKLFNPDMKAMKKLIEKK